MISEMHDFLREENRASDPFEIIVPAGNNLEAMQQFTEQGVTGIVNLPTLEEIGPGVSIDTMTHYIENYADTYIGKV